MREISEVAMLTSAQSADLYWPAIESALVDTQGTWEDYLTLDGIRNGLLTGNFQMWTVGDDKSILMAIMSRIIPGPLGNIMQLIWCSKALEAALDDCLDALELKMEPFAVMQQCSLVEVFGRPGWAKKLMKRGFELRQVRLSRPICIHTRH